MTDGVIGILVMAYGTAAGPQDVERYYTDIRGGRPPAPEHLRELLERYEAIGNRFPLLAITRAQAAGLEERLNREDARVFRCYLGMKHSAPFIAEGVEAMRRDGVARAIGIVMAPHWSAMSVETYVERVEAAVADLGGGPEFSFVRWWYDRPEFVEFLTGRVSEAIAKLPEGDREGAAIVFSAHSLPVRTEADGSRRCLHCHASRCQSSCAYRDQLAETGRLVCDRLGRPAPEIAWQSAGRTPDPWWGPPIEEVIRDLAAAGHRAVAVCSAGFVADHLEILYDLDIEAQEIAREAGIRLVRTEMPNADPAFLDALAAVVRGHLRRADR